MYRVALHEIGRVGGASETTTSRWRPTNALPRAVAGTTPVPSWRRLEAPRVEAPPRQHSREELSLGDGWHPAFSGGAAPLPPARVLAVVPPAADNVHADGTFCGVGHSP